MKKLTIVSLLVLLLVLPTVSMAGNSQKAQEPEASSLTVLWGDFTVVWGDLTVLWGDLTGSDETRELTVIWGD